MSLFKIPFIVAQLATFHVAMTAPHSTMQKERVKDQHWLETYVTISLSCRAIDAVRNIFTVAGLAEIAILLSSRYPSHLASSFVLGTLLFPAGSLDAIGWSLPALIGGIIVIAASGLRIWSMRTLDRLFTFEVSIRPKHRLVTTGPYDFVRHPSYIGAVFSYGGALLVFFARGGWTAGSGVLDTSIGRFVAVFWVVFFGTYLCAILVGRMPMEERVIKDMFGKEWERWADGVRWKLIPGVV